MMRIGVVSDTHGHVQNTARAVRALNDRKVELVIHCGDIGSVDVVQLFAGWTAHFVFGNVDHDERRLRAAIAEAGHVCHERFGELELEGVPIAFLHGDDRERLETTIASGRWRLVAHGHTHKAELYNAGSTLVLNPGALYRAAQHTVAVVELPSLEIEHVCV
jgi:putative phosphoesterase